MGLRTILIVISSMIVGLCISLYFQTGQSDQGVQSINYERYKSLEYSQERSISLVDLNEQIHPYKLQDIIQEIYEKNRLAGEKTRVMEIGAGNGRVLMELVKLFPEVEFYGINKEKNHTFYRRESYILTALKFGIFNKLDIEGINLPYVVFADLDFGVKIPYGENKFDLIYSQGMLPRIKYKFELFNEIMRILKKNGVSLHTDIRGVNLYSKGVVLPLRDGLAEFRKKGIEIRTLENKTSIMFKKPEFNHIFPVSPHQAIPANIDKIPLELRRPEMGYNITY